MVRGLPVRGAVPLLAGEEPQAAAPRARTATAATLPAILRFMRLNSKDARPAWGRPVVNDHVGVCSAGGAGRPGTSWRAGWRNELAAGSGNVGAHHFSSPRSGASSGGS